MTHGYKIFPGQNMTNRNEIIQLDKIRPVGQNISTGTKIKLWDKNCPGLRNVGQNKSRGNGSSWTPEPWKFTGNVTVVEITISWKKFT